MNISAHLRRRNELVVVFALVSFCALAVSTELTQAVSGALLSTGTLALVLSLRDIMREQRASRRAAERRAKRAAAPGRAPR